MVMELVFFLVILPAFGLIMSKVQSEKARREQREFKSYAGLHTEIVRPKPQQLRATTAKAGKPAETAQRKRGRPRKVQPEPQQPAVNLKKTAPAASTVKRPAEQEKPAAPDPEAAEAAGGQEPERVHPASAPQPFPQAFAGEVVAFSGTLPTMTRKEAVKAVKDRGGRAYESIHADCTILVVGEKPGKQQQERAERWNIKTITWEEWFKRAGISWRRRQVAMAIASDLKTA